MGAQIRTPSSRRVGLPRPWRGAKHSPDPNSPDLGACPEGAVRREQANERAAAQEVVSSPGSGIAPSRAPAFAKSWCVLGGG